ncbi:MAG: dienelactone hydrolase family protein [Myxococcota bacterium]
MIERLRFGPEDIYSGVAAKPARAPASLPGVIVIQEAWGVDAHIEDLVHRIAHGGYFALAPDWFSRRGVRPPALTAERLAEAKALFDELPGPVLVDPARRKEALTQKPEPLATRLEETISTIFQRGTQFEQNLEALLAGVRYLREVRPETRGQRLASVGFCMGGALSARLASVDTQLAGAVVFYGIAPPGATFHCPILGLYGATDARVNGTLETFAADMARSAQPLRRHEYAGAGHAFFNDTRGSYDVAAARDANLRLFEFLRERLGS